jgi:AcrR family transcriptional regulator
MDQPVKRRRYNSARRQAQAAQTRRAILDTARALFEQQGYAATTMAAIAERAAVSLETVYASVGTKPALVRLLVEIAISGVDQPVDAEQRDYVRAVRAEPSAAGKLRVYAGAVRRVQERMAPLFRMLSAAAPAHPELGALWTEIAERRARNMRLFAAELAETGQVRAGLSVEEIADVVWATNAAQFYALLVYERGWEPERFERWLADTWQRLFLG